MKRILLVDNDQGNLEVLLMLLEEEGYEAIALNNASFLDNYIERYQPVMILMDIFLGSENGAELCRNLKSNPSTAHIKIVLMAASNIFDKKENRYFLEDGYINKPFNIDEILEITRQMIGR